MKRFSIRIQDRSGFERRVPLGEVTVIGRQKQCDVVLHDVAVSRMHLRVECANGTCWVEDLDSLHGTYMDGERIRRVRWEPSTVVTLADGVYRLLLVQENLQSTDSNIRAILSTARRLTGEYDLHLILRKSLSHLLRLSGQERGFIMLPDPVDEGRLKIIVSRGMSADDAPAVPAAPDGDVCAAVGTLLPMASIQQVFDTGQPIWVKGIEPGKVGQTQAERPASDDLHLVAILCLPLLVRGKSIGIIYMDGHSKKLEPLDRGSFETIVGLCAVAIERARMAEEGRRNKILATVGTAASTIAMEFCGALEAIHTHIESLSLICLDDVAQLHLEQTRATLERLTSMSSKLLMFADIGPLEKTLVDMSRFLFGKIHDWRDKTEGSGVEIVGYGPECTAHIEMQNFSVIMDNLMTNSMTALVGKVPGAKIEISWEVAQNRLRIEVTDNGKGIPAEVLDSIFEPRFHLDRSGTGSFGLASVKMHIEEHGGTVGIASELEHGTTVTIELPLPPTETITDTLSPQTYEEGIGGA